MHVHQKFSSAFFRRDKLKLFAGGNRPMEEVMLSFFTSTQRISLAMSIISSIRLKTYLKGKSDVGITTLLTDKVEWK